MIALQADGKPVAAWLHEGITLAVVAPTPTCRAIQSGANKRNATACLVL
ncbi:MAG: hypothetical protein LBB76_12585 [Azoarcus sp.]|nr:hypothetical protein [Azoarcus sp.]